MIEAVLVYSFGVVEVFDSAVIWPPCLKGRFPHSVGEMSAKQTKGDGLSERLARRSRDWGIFLNKNHWKINNFHKVSLRLLLRKIHLPLGKGGVCTV